MTMNKRKSLVSAGKVGMAHVCFVGAYLAS
jgi:hypothetical protein